MAYYAALVSVVQLLDDILHRNRYPNLPLTKQPILKSLHEKFTSLEDLLQEYSSMGSETNDRVEGRIRDVAYRVQDIIECQISNQMLVSMGEAPADESIFHESSPLAGFYSPPNFLEMMLQEIDSVMQDLLAITEQGVSKGLKPNRDSLDIDALGSASVADVGRNTVVGFDADLTAIKERLCGQSTKLQVIPIVGMGGIGKTTLARAAFDDTLVAYYFDHRVWLTVSQDYQMDQVQQRIGSCLGLDNNCRHLEEKIYKRLKGRRYLIVMDDVWNTKVWDDVKWLFPDDCNGSRVMITTRLFEVARYAATSNILHEMHVLDDDESWNLLERKVFVERRCPSELEHIGKNIARQCHGLPLALVVVAGILSEVKTLDSWENIERNVRTIFRNINTHLTGILSISYNHLSHQLKACFLYMASFPEDYEIDISKLILLWIADGLLKSEGETKRLEELGEECLNDLVKRNLVMMKKGSSGEFKSCFLHDILRDFCKQRALFECFCHDIISEENYREFTPRLVESTVRRINFNFNSRHWGDPWDTDTFVRSVLIFGRSGWPEFDGNGRRTYRLVRVFDYAEQCPLVNILPVMFHLKYLKLRVRKSYRDLPRLSKLLPKLVNLQTIILYYHVHHYSDNLFSFKIWTMAQLRHVRVSPQLWLPSACGLGGQKLEYLQTLASIQGSSITSEVINMIPNLRKLNLIFDAEVTQDMPFFHILVGFHLLEELKIQYTFGHTRHGSHHYFLRVFALPSNLRELYLQYFKLSPEVMRMIGSLPNLRGLKLVDNDLDRTNVWVVAEREFPQLKFLSLKFFHYLEQLKAEGSSLFPCLEILEIRKCEDLTDIPLEIGDIPTLQLIDVYKSSRCKDSAIQIRKDQQELGNELLQVHIHK